MFLAFRVTLWHPYPEIHENLLKSMEICENSSKSKENRENQLKTMMKGRGRGGLKLGTWKLQLETLTWILV